MPDFGNNQQLTNVRSIDYNAPFGPFGVGRYESGSTPVSVTTPTGSYSYAGGSSQAPQQTSSEKQVILTVTRPTDNPRVQVQTELQMSETAAKKYQEAFREEQSKQQVIQQLRQGTEASRARTEAQLTNYPIYEPQQPKFEPSGAVISARDPSTISTTEKLERKYRETGEPLYGQASGALSFGKGVGIGVLAAFNPVTYYETGKAAVNLFRGRPTGFEGIGDTLRSDKIAGAQIIGEQVGMGAAGFGVAKVTPAIKTAALNTAFKYPSIAEKIPRGWVRETGTVTRAKSLRLDVEGAVKRTPEAYGSQVKGAKEFYTTVTVREGVTQTKVAGYYRNIRGTNWLQTYLRPTIRRTSIRSFEAEGAGVLAQNVVTRSGEPVLQTSRELNIKQTVNPKEFSMKIQDVEGIKTATLSKSFTQKNIKKVAVERSIGYRGNLQVTKNIQEQKIQKKSGLVGMNLLVEPVETITRKRLSRASRPVLDVSRETPESIKLLPESIKLLNVPEMKQTFSQPTITIFKSEVETKQKPIYAISMKEISENKPALDIKSITASSQRYGSITRSALDVESISKTQQKPVVDIRTKQEPKTILLIRPVLRAETKTRIRPILKLKPPTVSLSSAKRPKISFSTSLFKSGPVGRRRRSFFELPLISDYAKVSSYELSTGRKAKSPALSFSNLRQNLANVRRGLFDIKLGR